MCFARLGFLQETYFGPWPYPMPRSVLQRSSPRRPVLPIIEHNVLLWTALSPAKRTVRVTAKMWLNARLALRKNCPKSDGKSGGESKVRARKRSPRLPALPDRFCITLKREKLNARFTLRPKPR